MSKGLSRPTSPWGVVDPSQTSRRFDTRYYVLTPLDASTMQAVFFTLSFQRFPNKTYHFPTPNPPPKKEKQNVTRKSKKKYPLHYIMRINIVTIVTCGRIGGTIGFISGGGPCRPPWLVRGTPTWACKGGGWRWACDPDGFRRGGGWLGRPGMGCKSKVLLFSVNSPQGTFSGHISIAYRLSKTKVITTVNQWENKILRKPMWTPPHKKKPKQNKTSKLP